jgi:hypothetical protein
MLATAAVPAILKARTAAAAAVWAVVTIPVQIPTGTGHSIRIVCSDHAR